MASRPASPPAAAGAIAATKAGAAALLAPSAVGLAGIAAGGVVTVATAAALLKALTSGLDDFLTVRFGAALVFIGAALREQFPDVPEPVLKRKMVEVEDREREFEAVFRQKMKDRLARDLPRALAIADPKGRADAVSALLDREKRFTQMREEAMLTRSIANLELAQLRELSPKLVYWRLSDHVAEHCPKCLVLGNSLWPWEVVDRLHPPLHPGCPCELWSLDEALGEGLVDETQIPDPDDAMRRAETALRRVSELKEAFGAEVVEAAVAEATTAPSEPRLATPERTIPRQTLPSLAAPNLAKAEATLSEAELRWGRGYKEGGRFRPKLGGEAHAILKKLLPHGLPVAPTAGRRRGDGRHVWAGGHYLEIPAQRGWERKIGGVRYHSPAGGTNLYRAGKLVNEPGQPSLAREKRPLPRSTGGTVAEKASSLRAAGRQAAIERASGVGAPVSVGDGPEAFLALPHAGFTVQSSATVPDGTKVEFRRGREQLEVVYGDDEIRSVKYLSKPKREVLHQAVVGAPPSDFAEFQKDALAWAEELGLAFDADVDFPGVRVNPELWDHAGQHDWSGWAEVGRDVPGSIDRAGQARAAGRPLTWVEKGEVWASYWATAHEMSHSINPIPQALFQGGQANLEEALTEEAAHLLAVKRLSEQGQQDVIDWRNENPTNEVVHGNYRRARHVLSLLMDEAGVTDPGERQKLVYDLKFKVAPERRYDRLTEHVRAKTGGDYDEIHARVEGLFDGSAEPPVGLPESPGGWLYKLFGDDEKPSDKLKHGKHKGKKGWQKPKQKLGPPKPHFIGGDYDALPATGPIPSYDSTRLRLGGVAGGSNGAHWAQDDHGNRWLVKDYRGDQDRVATELLANAVYRAMGARVPVAGSMRVGKHVALTYPALEGEVKNYAFDKGPSEELGKHFMTDALTANWDVAGLSDDNVLWDADGNPIRLDQGGTFEYRAMGNAKSFGPIPTEVWSMMDKGQGARSMKVDEDGMRLQARKIAKVLTGPKIDALVDAAPFEDNEARERVRENFKARVGWMRDFGAGKIDLPKPLEGDEAKAMLAEKEKGFDPFPEQEDALFGFMEGLEGELNGYLRNPKLPTNKVLDRAKTELDSVMRAVDPTDEDVIAYVGLSLGPEGKPFGDDLVGQTLQEKGFLSATLDEDSANQFSSVLRMVVPEGSHLLYTPGLGYDDMPDEPQVIVARNSKLRIKGRRIVDGKVVFDVVLKTEKPFKPYVYKPPKNTKGATGGGKGPSGKAKAAQHVKGLEMYNAPPASPESLMNLFGISKADAEEVLGVPYEPKNPDGTPQKEPSGYGKESKADRAYREWQDYEAMLADSGKEATLEQVAEADRLMREAERLMNAEDGIGSG